MSILDFQGWSLEHLKAFATLTALATFVGGLIFILRELGARSAVSPQRKKLGRFGFPVSNGEVVEMEVLQIRQLSPTVKNFRLQPPKSNYVDYNPGQFLSFHTGKNQDVIRCYSLNSSPSRPGLYEVSVKKLEGGLGSTWMHEEVKVGDKLKVTSPSGRFFFRGEGQSSVFVAGGVGITAMIAMIKYAIDQGDSRPLYFFYSSRTEEELVFHEELQDLCSRSPHAHYIPIVSQPTESWTGETGRIQVDLMLQSGVDFKNAELYTCGPAPLMDSAKQIAIENGMLESRFHNEVFTSPASQKMEHRQCQVLLNQAKKTLSYDSNIPLLDFLEENNIPMQFSCRAGVCGACEVTLTKGKVHQLPSDFLSPEDLREGRRLSCISYPQEDLELDL